MEVVDLAGLPDMAGRESEDFIDAPSSVETVCDTVHSLELFLCEGPSPLHRGFRSQVPAC